MGVGHLNSVVHTEPLDPMRRLGIVLLLLLPGCLPPTTRVEEPWKLMVFGGDGHKTYLGCLSCPGSAYDSVFNPESPFGSCRSQFDSLYCRGTMSLFGPSASLYPYSACAMFSADPPVLVDGSGRYYGRLSVGNGLGHAESVCALLGRFSDARVCAAVKKICGQR
jgi:hypothetical protein